MYHVLTNSAVAAEATMFLPRVETMVAVFYFGLFAASFDFISGYTGYLSFGHAVFYGAGAYLVVLAANGKLAVTVPFTGIRLLAYDTQFMVLVVLAGLLALVLAVLIGLVSFRLTGVYFAMITLGFAQVVYVFVRDWSFVSESPADGAAVVGPEGATPPAFDVGVPFVDSLNLAIGQLAGESVEGLFGTLSFSTAEVSYYMIGLVVLVSYLLMQRVIHSPFGRVMIAIRENEERARAVGYDTFRYKLAAFAVSGFFAGVAGALFAGFRRSVAPDNSLYFLVSGDALLASIIGGFGTLAGPIFGRLFDESVREFLSKEGSGGGLLPFLREQLSQSALTTELFNGLTVQEAIETFLNGHASLYLGLLFVLFVLFVPNGLLGTLRDRLGGTVAKQVSERLARLRR
ncbi:branched-chain amino acid ABC transporter permease [Halorarius halobius]|uniref:branched-chain amino acid ABC transporter permease n=1 Tax=Halorarius halobius TaxID=2962671 RepID=UPI0020CD4BF6|nr:branched-chain amino acid ABC transporter permease [Halorarius halobius]